MGGKERRNQEVRIWGLLSNRNRIKCGDRDTRRSRCCPTSLASSPPWSWAIVFLSRGYWGGKERNLKMGADSGRLADGWDGVKKQGN